ncbi:MAG: DegV family protein [Anaerolineaceae bacterium]
MIKIIADTTCGIPVEELKSKGIAVIPQVITFGTTSYHDDYELTTDKFLDLLSRSKELPGTAAPAPSLYNPYYRDAQVHGDQVLVITPSGDLSGTFRSATVAAADYPDVNIHVVDTRTIAGGLGTLVLLAKQWADEGLPMETIKQRVIEKAKTCRIFFLVATLEYLHKGGRIGSASKLVGGLLQIKPILCIQDGKIEPFDKVRTYKQALITLEELNSKLLENNPEAYLSISQCGADEDAITMAESFKKRFNIPEVPIYLVPPAIVVHAGPGVLATSIFTKPE